MQDCERILYSAKIAEEADRYKGIPVVNYNLTASHS